MQELNNASLVLALTEKLRENRSWAGETHLQKAAYILGRILQVPIPFKFILYKHGPFSFDLRDEISWMRSVRFLEWEIRNDCYGPSLKAGPMAPILKRQFPEMPRTYAAELEFVAGRFGQKNVAELERLTTAIYVTSEEEAPPHERAGHIHNLKPHISIPEAEAAVLEADTLLRAARGRFARAMIA